MISRGDIISLLDFFKSSLCCNILRKNMLQYIFISSVICFFFFLLFDSITCDFKAIGLDVWKRIILCFVLTLVYKCCLGFEFYGLEYEDAYVFDVAARQFSQGIYTSQFMTEIVESGSIEKPEFMGVYGGHFVTYPGT